MTSSFVSVYTIQVWRGWDKSSPTSQLCPQPMGDARARMFPSHLCPVCCRFSCLGIISIFYSLLSIEESLLLTRFGIQPVMEIQPFPELGCAYRLSPFTSQTQPLIISPLFYWRYLPDLYDATWQATRFKHPISLTLITCLKQNPETLTHLPLFRANLGSTCRYSICCQSQCHHSPRLEKPL